MITHRVDGNGVAVVNSITLNIELILRPLVSASTVLLPPTAYVLRAHAYKQRKRFHPCWCMLMMDCCAKQGSSAGLEPYRL